MFVDECKHEEARAQQLLSDASSSSTASALEEKGASSEAPGGLSTVPEDLEELSDAEQRLMSLSVHILRDYATRAKRHDPEEGTDSVHHLSIVVCSLLDGLLRLSQAQLAKHLHALYPLCMELVAVGSSDVRQVLRKLLLNRVGRIMAL